ncbi:MAG: NADH-quinone oxidoreductase subunit C [Candidatus Omnitrophota bacterium]|jgi:Ni,Fe-hydrogenase III component G
MSLEENIKNELEEKFPFLASAIVIKRQRRIFVDIPQENFAEVFSYLIMKMQFSILVAITGLDEGNNMFGVMYHLCRETGQMCIARIHIPRENPLIKTVTSFFPSAEAYEREMVDLLGIHVEGLAPGHRYPLPDNWPVGEFPLRKEWKLEARHDIKENPHV